MNTKRILTWGSFILIIALIIWGLIAASNKAKQEEKGIVAADVVTSEDWVSSTTTTPVTIIEYSDFQCPACAAYFPLIERLLQENPTQVRLVYRHFPLTQHANAVPAAKASEAAGMQGKFFEMYRLIFANQANWQDSPTAEEIFKTYAQQLGLDMAKYEVDVASAQVEENVNNDLKGGIRAGVNSTPTFYVNGKKIDSPNGYEEFKTIIDTAASDNS